MLYYLFIFVTFFSFLHSEDLTCYASVENKYVIELQKRIKEADQKLEIFNDQLVWFFEYTRFFDDNELETSEVKKEWLQKFRDFKEEFEALQESFLIFRLKLGNCHLALPGSFFEGYLDYSLTILQVTSWYINYVREKFFPQDWENLYSAYRRRLESEKMSNNSLFQ